SRSSSGRSWTKADGGYGTLHAGRRRLAGRATTGRSPRAPCSARHHHDLALDLAPGQVEQRLAGFLERVALRDRRPPLARGIQRDEVLHVLLGLLRVATREGAPERADQRAALEQREIERHLRDVAGGEADDEVAAVPADRAEGRFGHGAA